MESNIPKTNTLGIDTNYLGIDFKSITVNEIILRNIFKFLSQGDSHEVNSKKLPSGLIVHVISRSGYRLLELPGDIKTEQDFDQYIYRNKDTIYKQGYHSFCGYFKYNGVYYIVVSKEINNSKEDIKKTILITKSSVNSILDNKK